MARLATWSGMADARERRGWAVALDGTPSRRLLHAPRVTLAVHERHSSPMTFLGAKVDPRGSRYLKVWGWMTATVI